MASIRQWLLRIVSVFRHGRAEDELRREVNAHLELLEEKFRTDGLSPPDAALAARKAFGGVEQAKERQRDARSFRWIDDLQRDARYAFRSLRRSPAFTTAAVLTLAIGIGATTAIYSVVNTVLISALPFERGDRLVRLVEPEINPRTMRGINYNEYLEWRRRTTTLSGMSALTFNPQVMMPTREGTARLTAAMISANYFDVFGMNAMLGRVITQSDEANPDVIVLSYDTWQRFFRGEADAIGSVIELRGSLGSGPSNLGADSKQPARLLTIVGVLPDVYETNGAVFDVYMPFAPGMFAQPPGAGRVQARLRDGVSLAAAEEEANVIGNALRPPRPATEPPLTKPRFALAALQDEIVEPVRPALRVFLVAVAVVLLIVCANVANLLLARGASAFAGVGGPPGRSARAEAALIRQILTECLVLSVVGGTLGAALGAAGVHTGQDPRHHRRAGHLPSQLRRRLAAAHQRSPRRRERRAHRVRVVPRRQHRVRPVAGAAAVAGESPAGDGHARQRRHPCRDADPHRARRRSAGARHRAPRERGPAGQQLHEPVASGKGLRPRECARLSAGAAAGIRHRAQGRHH